MQLELFDSVPESSSWWLFRCTLWRAAPRLLCAWCFRGPVVVLVVAEKQRLAQLPLM